MRLGPRALLGVVLASAALGGCGGGARGSGGAPGNGGQGTTGTTASSGSAGGSTSGPDAGSCTPACAGAATCCGGQCLATTTDPDNCGACGVVCAAGTSCCKGACANLELDPRNCGACGAACPAGDTCSKTGCSDWASWPIPNPAGAALPNPAGYTSMTGYVIDSVTKLWWQQPIDGKNNLGASCSAGCTQAQAVTYCENLTLATHNDWRLPTRIELASLTDYTAQTPALDATAFPGTPATAFWTSSPYLASAGSGWCVDFGDGTTNGVATSFSTRVRCVR